MRLLVVEDARELALAIVEGMERHGFVVDVCEDGEGALALENFDRYACIVLDCMLPRMDGLDVCRALRARGSDTPILMLTARDTVEDRVAGLEVGADDYLVKPFAFAELVARVRALTRRRTAWTSNVLRAGDVVVDLASGRVSRGTSEVALSMKERQILVALMRHPGRLVTHAELVDQAWHMEDVPSPQVIRAHIKNLRKKLTDEGAGVNLIETVHGMGYRVVS
jgi:two-component system OmpR family response regulator